MATGKHTQYAALVAERKRCHRCEGLRNPAESELSVFDSKEIGPWSRLHGDLDANVMVIGQDWGDVRYYNENKGLDKPGNPTTQTLAKLLQEIGLDISLTEYDTGSRGLFLTNAILCLKQGGLQGLVQQKWFEQCGSNFLRRQIEIVAPRVAIALGQKACGAALSAFGLCPAPLREAVEDEAGTALPNGTRLFAVYHCGQRTLNTHRHLAQQQQDWRRVKKFLERQNLTQ